MIYDVFIEGGHTLSCPSYSENIGSFDNEAEAIAAAKAEVEELNEKNWYTISNNEDDVHPYCKILKPNDSGWRYRVEVWKH